MTLKSKHRSDAKTMYEKTGAVKYLERSINYPGLYNKRLFSRVQKGRHPMSALRAVLQAKLPTFHLSTLRASGHSLVNVSSDYLSDFRTRTDHNHTKLLIEVRDWFIL